MGKIIACYLLSFADRAKDKQQYTKHKQKKEIKNGQETYMTTLSDDRIIKTLQKVMTLARRLSKQKRKGWW